MKKRIAVAMAVALFCVSASAYAGSVWGNGSVVTNSGFSGAGMFSSGSSGGFNAGGSAPWLSVNVGGDIQTSASSGGGGFHHGDGNYANTTANLASSGNAQSNCHSAIAGVSSNATSTTNTAGNVTSTTDVSAGGTAFASTPAHWGGWAR